VMQSSTPASPTNPSSNGANDTGPASTLERATNSIRAGNSLSEQDSFLAMRALTVPGIPQAVSSAYLEALVVKGESVDEIVGSARAVLSQAVPFPKQDEALDTCGTGGDGGATFNVSTAAALVVAAAGVEVVKHGNRSSSGRVGSADLLEALGIRIDVSPEELLERLRRFRFAFLFAPQFHPAVKALAPVRRQLKRPTIFNLIGPLCNPARPPFQVVGVCSPAIAERMALAMSRLGLRRAAIVTGPDRIDELAPSGENRVWFVAGSEITPSLLSASDAGLAHCELAELRGGDAATNAEIVRAVLRGERGAPRDAVLMNAGLALVVAGRCPTLAQGCACCAEAIDQGAALRLLEDLREEGCSEGPRA